ncbi:ABC transporter ATP-binding protein [Mycoplasmatota bacterium]|nr:ABC transporter ATP-binding protein [Mycoplasmatota bacterium]
MKKIISVKDLQKSYDDIKAVKGISFDVIEGEFFAFLGPNGAGKSTTINIICTLLEYDNGEVIVDDNALGKDDNLIRKKVGVVFQENMLDRRLSVRQNLDIRGSFYGLDQVSLESRINTISNMLDLGKFIDQKYGTLSGGQRRKADIARALINTPSILILDEPTTGLDPKTRSEVWQIIEKLRNDEHITIFLTTHYMEEANTANNVVIINEGEIVATGTPEQLRIKYSSDVLKIVPSSDQILSLLDELDIKYQKSVDSIIIRIKDSLEGLRILNNVDKYVEAFEVIRGNMDDVFINITGNRLEV